MSTNASFECVAEGYKSESFKYQWMFNDIKLPDVSDKTLMLTSVGEDMSGVYECVVINQWSVAVKSPSAQLTVTSNEQICFVFVTGLHG